VIGPDGEFERMERVTADLPDPPAISFDMSTLVTPETMLSWPQPVHSADENVGEIERRRPDYMLVGLEDGTVENLGSFPQAIARVLADGGMNTHAYQPFSPRTYHALGGGPHLRRRQRRTRDPRVHGQRPAAGVDHGGPRVTRGHRPRPRCIVVCDACTVGPQAGRDPDFFDVRR
jgi:hypothetical protein